MRFAPSTDGVEVAVHDLGGDAAPLVVVHATGFHGRVFAPLAELLATEFHCWGPDLRGHGDSRTPSAASYEWSGLADDVLAAAETISERPVFGFGHSSGAAALLMAEAREPGRFAGLYCFEPIIWPNPEAMVERAHRLADGALHRKPRFATREDAYANYQAKPPFSWLDERALSAYVDHGFVDLADGTVGLKCSPQIEAVTYLKGAENRAFADLGRVACPVVVARGTGRDAIDREVAQAQVAAIADARLEEFEGLGHFGPLQAPATLAPAIGEAFLGR